MPHNSGNSGRNSGSSSSNSGNFTPASGQSYFTPAGGGQPQPASAGGVVSQGYTGRGAGSGSGGAVSAGSGGISATGGAPAAQITAVAPTPWLQIGVSAFGIPIYERKIGGVTERVAQTSTPTEETQGIPQPVTYTPSGVELKYITKEGKFVYGAAAERTIIPAGDRPVFQANILTAIKDGVTIDPFAKQPSAGSQKRDVFRGGIEHKYTTQEGKFVYGAVTQQTVVPAGARPNFQANILTAVSTGYEGKQPGVTVSPYPVRIKEDIAEPSGITGAYERSNRYLSEKFKGSGLFETDYLDRELGEYTKRGAESRRRQESGEGIRPIEEYIEFSAEKSGPFILGIEKGVKERIREKPLSIATDFALIAGGGYGISAARFGLVKLAGRFPSLKGGVTRVRQAGGLAGKGLVVAYGGTVAYNIATTPGGAFEKGQTTGSEVVTAGAFVAGGKFATRVTRPINYQTEFEEGLQALPKARQAAVRAEIAELKPQLETIKGGAVKPTELEFSQVERLDQRSAPIVKKFVLDYKEQLVVGGSLGQRTQIPVSRRAKLSKPSDVDIYSDNPSLARILASELRGGAIKNREIYHYTKTENVKSILSEGYLKGKPSTHYLEGGESINKNIYYFTRDPVWSKANDIKLVKLVADIKPGDKVLTIKNFKQFDYYSKKLGLGYSYDYDLKLFNAFLGKAKSRGFDIVRMQGKGDWDRPIRGGIALDSKQSYYMLTAGPGKDDFYVLNKQAFQNLRIAEGGTRAKKGIGKKVTLKGQKIYIEGVGKAVEFHALTERAAAEKYSIGASLNRFLLEKNIITKKGKSYLKGTNIEITEYVKPFLKPSLKVPLESTLGTVSNPLLPYSSSFVKTPEGVRITKIPLQAQRKLYGGFEVSKDAKGKAYMYRYSKDIPNYKQLVSATLRRENALRQAQTNRQFSLLIRGKKAQVGLPQERFKAEKQSSYSYRLNQKLKSPTNEKYAEYKKVSTYTPYRTIPRYGGYTSPSPYRGYPSPKGASYPASKKIISSPYPQKKESIYTPLPKADRPYIPSPERPYTPHQKLRQSPYSGIPRPPRSPPYKKPEGLLTPPPSKIKIPKFGIELPEEKIKIPSEKRKRGYRFTPSLVASELNIVAPKGVSGFTGFEVRGLTKKFKFPRGF